MKQNPQPRVSSNVRRSRAASNSALITRGGPFGFARTTPAAQPAPTLATALGVPGRHFQKSGGQPLVCRWIRSRAGEGAPVPRPRGATCPPIAGEGNYLGWLLVASRSHHNKSLVRDCRDALVQFPVFVRWGHEEWRRRSAQKTPAARPPALPVGVSGA